MTSLIESLENRIAPATFSFIDLDGDRVTIQSSASEPLNLGDEVFLSSNDPTSPAALLKLDLSKAAFAGKAISFLVNKARFGDGKVNIGYVDASGIDLSKIVIPGDLGRIDVGDANLETRALNGLKVQSFGAQGLTTQGNTGNLQSNITGPVGTILVVRNVEEANININGDATLVSIGGDIVGGEAAFSGGIFMHDGVVKVAGDIVGGGGQESGIISGGYNVVATVSGSLIGGEGLESGRVVVGTGIIAVGRIIGGTGPDSGSICGIDGLHSVRVQGSIFGGSGSGSGSILSLGDTETVRVRGSIYGGSAPDSGSIICIGDVELFELKGNIVGGSSDNTGYFRAEDHLKKAIIYGSIMAGSVPAGEKLKNAGGLYTLNHIGSVVVHGDLVGNANSRVFIAAGGHDDLDGQPNLAIGRVQIKGSVYQAEILAGILLTVATGEDYSYFDADASIGSVLVNGDWRASSIVAGAMEDGPNGFGNGDVLQTADNDPAKLAEIASIIIKGSVSGSSIRGDFYGFVAQHLKELKIGGVVYAFEIGPSNDQFLIPGTIDVSAFEVSAAPAQ